MSLYRGLTKIAGNGVKSISTDIVSFDISTWNVREFQTFGTPLTDDSDADVTPYIKYLNSLKADVLCTQEDRVYLYDADATGGQTVFEKIYSNWFRNQYINTSNTNTKKTHARRICTNYMFYNNGVIELNNIQIAVYGVINVKGKEVLIVNPHLSWVEGIVSWSQLRKDESQKIRDTIKSLGYEYVVVCGDFNAITNVEYSWWSDSEWNKANAGVLGTFNTYDNGTSQEPDDNIITTKNIKIGNVEVIPNEFRDHFALSAKLTLL